MLAHSRSSGSGSGSSGDGKRCSSSSSSADWATTTSPSNSQGGRPPQHLQAPRAQAQAQAQTGTMEVENQLPPHPQHAANGHMGGVVSGLSASMAQHQHFQPSQGDVFRPQHPHDPQSQQQHGLYNHRQLSPHFQHRSSPIAIIHNPEDSAEQAKLRYQHPMYDTSDDEFDEDDYFHNSEGISVESLTSHEHRSPFGGPQSLPTKLLRAPKLGSLSGQDYRLHHLSSLPPPMSLNDDDSAPELGTSFTGGQRPNFLSQSTRQRPTYLSSYGSLRESHLTGRFGGQQAPASTGNLTDNRKVRFEQTQEPPLIPPHVPAQIQPPQPGQSPPQISPQQQQAQSQQKQPPLSIRDRMMQKTQQQKEREAQRDLAKPASTLSAMLEQQQQDPQKSGNTSLKSPPAADPDPLEPTNSSTTAILPEGLAQAVAVSYQSNLQLLHNAQQNHRGQEEEQQRHSSTDHNSILSSSMTGLEILRAANRNSQPLTRPTSLSILQGSSDSGLFVPPPPQHAPVFGNSNNGKHSFPSLARSNSEPIPHWDTASDINAFNGAPERSAGAGATLSNGATHLHATMSSPSLVHRGGSGAPIAFNASTLIPPRSSMALSIQQPQQSAALPMPHSTISTQNHSVYPQDAWTTTSASTLSNGYVSYQNDEGNHRISDADPDEHNPDTEEAFDMDLE